MNNSNCDNNFKTNCVKTEFTSCGNKPIMPPACQCIGVIGPTGPTGPAGGPTGPTGPAGTSGILGYADFFCTNAT